MRLDLAAPCRVELLFAHSKLLPTPAGRKCVCFAADESKERLKM